MGGETRRWGVVALVFLASAINYADRQIIALLKPVLEQDLGWNDSDYGHIVSAFQLATAACLVAAGWFVDRVGVRRGYAWGVGVWSLAALAHGLARTVGQFTLARVVLGASETVNTPAAVKSVAAWFPGESRSMAMGLVNAAPNLGAILVPLLVPALALALGWRAAFFITGATGFVWLAAWTFAARGAAETAETPSATAAGSGGARPSWAMLLRSRSTWAVAGAKVLSDLGWWFLLFWAPDFFHKHFGLELARLGAPLALVYAMAATGSFVGGYAATWLLRRRVRLNRARKGVMLAAALLVMPIPLVLLTPSYWTAALVLGLALAAHQAFSANLFAATADLFPASSVASVIGLAATAGTLGGMGILEFAGWTLQHAGSYLPMFLVCAVAYLLALGWFQLFVPDLASAAHADGRDPAAL